MPKERPQLYPGELDYENDVSNSMSLPSHVSSLTRAHSNFQVGLSKISCCSIQVNFADRTPVASNQAESL